MDNSARKGGTVQWRTSERIIRANERLIEYLHRACGHTRGGRIHPSCSYLFPVFLSVVCRATA
eukprot:scaffold38569_cov63-Phaeocystis_antarctica.AAC.2